MELLLTIQEVHKMFDTPGSSPLLVTCNDFNDWVCKYDQHGQYLFNEILTAEFAKFWEIRVPETAFITVKEDHIPYAKYPSLSPKLFMKECFGSRYLKNTVEINLSLAASFREKLHLKILNSDIEASFLNITF